MLYIQQARIPRIANPGVAAVSDSKKIGNGQIMPSSIPTNQIQKKIDGPSAKKYRTFASNRESSLGII